MYKNAINANCLRLDDPFLTIKKDSQSVNTKPKKWFNPIMVKLHEAYSEPYQTY